MQFRLFSHDTCDALLAYRMDPKIRASYDSDSFEYDGLSFLPQFISINLAEDISQFGVKPSDDLENSMRIFLALRHLDPTQANDRRLWVTLTHTLFFSYSKLRWNISSKSSDRAIGDRMHFEGVGLRARNQNSIARLWWAAHITYDETRADPFELTKLLWERQDFYQGLIDRRISTYGNVMKTFLNFYAANRHIDLKYEMRKIFKAFNALGGVKVLAAMEPAEVSKQLARICRYYGIKYRHFE